MSQVTDWVAGVLETDADILVPVKKLWNAYTAKGSSITLDALTQELDDDARFEFMGGVDPEEEFGDWSEEEIAEYEAEMEARGYFNGPRVKLKSRELTMEHIAKMMAKSTDRMMQALWSAHDARPEEMDAAAEQELLDLIVRAKNFQLDAEDAIKPDEV